MADYLALNQWAGTGAVMQVEINFTGNRPDASSGTAPYFKAADVLAEVERPATTTTVAVVTPMSLVQVNANTFRTVSLVPTGSILRLYRKTEDKYPLVDFNALQNVTERDLDNLTRQAVFMSGEAKDAATQAKEVGKQGVAIAVTANISAGEANENASVAVEVSATALGASQAAVITANSADGKAGQAVTTANTANGKADTAVQVSGQATKPAPLRNSPLPPLQARPPRLTLRPRMLCSLLTRPKPTQPT